MDPVILTFYAIICAVLGWAAPNIGGPLKRLGVGAGVGIVAAAIFPTLRTVLGL